MTPRLLCSLSKPSGSFAPLGRSSHSANVVGDKLMVFGGEQKPREPIDARLHVFDLASKTWTAIIDATSDAPSPRVGHGTATLRDKIFLFGGRGGAEMRPFNDLYEFDAVAKKWSRVNQTGDVPPARSYFSTAASKASFARVYHLCIGYSSIIKLLRLRRFQDHVYLFGGCPAEGRLNDLYRFDPKTTVWTQLPSHNSISPRGGAGLAYLNGRIYLHGGFNGQELNDLWAFDIASNSWQELTTTDAVVPEGRSVHGFAAIEEKGVLVCMLGERDPSAEGHLGAGKYHDDIWILQPQTENAVSWRKASFADAAEKPSPRAWFPAASWKDSVVLHGGFTGNDRDDSVFVFRLE
ncbi:hypothetical protein PhCBS80983_g01306 [Powellomyces hirtus]|uniref:Kelch repeat protein n=1 Tax=Powellomyces hirtus TaxID=109895 RepID=A0A507EBU1_9FUNG|nr:hypothetical protein PhCBS80983_g01306 [Powellomyces hirtus]